MKAAQTRWKSCANQRCRPLEFQVGDQIFLKVSPTKGLTQFGMAGKLSPRYIGLYLVIQSVGGIAYRLELSPKISRVNNVFHVSQLRKYISDSSYVIETDPIQLQENLSYEEKLMQILEWREKQLCRKMVPFVKVL